MLRVIQRLKQRSSISIKATFLGAHAWPEAYRQDHQGYIGLITGEMLPVIAAEGLADYIDVFCEDRVFQPCRDGDHPARGTTIRVGGEDPCQSVAFVERRRRQVSGWAPCQSTTWRPWMNRRLPFLAGSGTIGTLLPTAAFFLRMPYQPARALIDAGCAIALASDFNPGSSPSGNMNLVVSIACIQMRLLPEEAINAATLNGAYAMSLGDRIGSITPGKWANLIITRPVPSLAYLPYAFGTNLIEKVMIRGEFIQ